MIRIVGIIRIGGVNSKPTAELWGTGANRDIKLSLPPATAELWGAKLFFGGDG